MSYCEASLYTHFIKIQQFGFLNLLYSNKESHTKIYENRTKHHEKKLFPIIHWSLNTLINIFNQNLFVRIYFWIMVLFSLHNDFGRHHIRIVNKCRESSALYTKCSISTLITLIKLFYAFKSLRLLKMDYFTIPGSMHRIDHSKLADDSLNILNIHCVNEQVPVRNAKEKSRYVVISKRNNFILNWRTMYKCLNIFQQI